MGTVLFQRDEATCLHLMQELGCFFGADVGVQEVRERLALDDGLRAVREAVRNAVRPLFGDARLIG